jgi:hypothetical protein
LFQKFVQKAEKHPYFWMSVENEDSGIKSRIVKGAINQKIQCFFKIIEKFSKICDETVETCTEKIIENIEKGA